MAFNTPELESIADSALDYYFRSGELFNNHIQTKPWLAKAERAAKSFSGGKGDISIGVKGDYGFPLDRSTGNPVTTPTGGSDQVSGYTHDDQVLFYTPANNRRANWPWREHHIGITVTHTELKIDGLSVTDTDGRGTRSLDGREKHAIANLFESKLDDLGEQYARGMNDLMWGDGTGDAKAMAGLRHILTPNGAAGVVGGLDKSSLVWWRNRARTADMAAAIVGDPTLGYLGGDEVTSSSADGGALLQVMQYELRQLRRYGGRPDCWFAGSDFIDAMETELRANGNYSDSGFTARQDGGMGDLYFKGIRIVYDPTLDDDGFSKRAYVFDSRDIFLMKLQGEWRRRHSPSRPHDYFVLYRSITSTGQLCARRINSGGVYDIA